MSILVVGSVAYDTVETPFGTAERVLGGSASFFSVAASFFVPVRLVAVIGDDFGEEQLAAFRDRPIDLEGLERMVAVVRAEDRSPDPDPELVAALKRAPEVLEGDPPPKKALS